MRLSISLFTTVALGLFATVALAQEPSTASAQLEGADGKNHGAVTLSQTPHGVLLTADLRGLPEGAHGFHIHETGKCEPPFKSAGGHFNPAKHLHGILAAEGMHAGDMPNIHTPASGDLHIEVLNTSISLDPDDEGNIFDEDGSAIVIHAKADDYSTDPAGNAGDRIACGIVRKSPAG